MMRWWPCAVLCCVVACGSDKANKSDGSDGSDQTEEQPSSDAGAKSDSGASDSGGEVPTTFCSSQTDAFLCLDFDPPHDSLTWFVTGQSVTGGGAAEIDGTSSVSAPNSAKFSVVEGARDQSANISTKRSFTGAIGKQSFSFQLHLASSCIPAPRDAGAELAVSLVSVGFALSRAEDGGAISGELALAVAADGAAIAELPRTAEGLSAPTLHLLPQLPTDTWANVELAFDPTAQTVAVAVDGGAPTTIELSELATANITGDMGLAIGPTNQFVMPSCTLGVDNFLWFN